VHLDAGFVDRLVNAGLVCTKRATALKDERNTLKRQETRCTFGHAFQGGRLIHKLLLYSSRFVPDRLLRLTVATS
jgi:hypothetical protein